MRRRDERGSAVVDFVLVMIILVPLFLGILQVALVLHVRNTLTAAASDGATAGHLLTAATEGALANVRINAGSMKDVEQAQRMRTEADALHARAAELLAATLAAFSERTA